MGKQFRWRTHRTGTRSVATVYLSVMNFILKRAADLLFVGESTREVSLWSVSTNCNEQLSSFPGFLFSLLLTDSVISHAGVSGRSIVVSKVWETHGCTTAYVLGCLSGWYIHLLRRLRRFTCDIQDHSNWFQILVLFQRVRVTNQWKTAPQSPLLTPEWL